MSANTPLWKAHDISQQLQDKIEVLPNVERAFVHVDHEATHTPVRAVLVVVKLALASRLLPSAFSYPLRVATSVPRAISHILPSPYTMPTSPFTKY